mgnify:CR=1 FL=1
MAVKYTSADGTFKIECTPKQNPRLIDWIRDDLMAQIHQEWKEFLEEVAVAVRTIQPGQRIELSSKPVPVIIEREELPPPPQSNRTEE